MAIPESRDYYEIRRNGGYFSPRFGYVPQALIDQIEAQYGPNPYKQHEVPEAQTLLHESRPLSAKTHTTFKEILGMISAFAGSLKLNRLTRPLPTFTHKLGRNFS